MVALDIVRASNAQLRNLPTGLVAVFSMPVFQYYDMFVDS